MLARIRLSTDAINVAYRMHSPVNVGCIVLSIVWQMAHSQPLQVFYAKHFPCICVHFKNSFEKANEVSIFVLPLLRKGGKFFQRLLQSGRKIISEI